VKKKANARYNLFIKELSKTSHLIIIKNLRKYSITKYALLLIEIY